MTTRLSVEHHRKGYHYRVQLLVRSREHFEEKKQQLQDLILKLDAQISDLDDVGATRLFTMLGEETRNRFNRTVRVRITDARGYRGEQHFVSRADAGMKRP